MTVRLLLCSFLFVIACHMSAQNKFIISNKIDTSKLNPSNFYSPQILSIKDSLSKKIGGEYFKTEQENNTAVIYFYETGSTKRDYYTPAVTSTFFYNDTLRIIAGIGLFGGLSISILIDKNSFTGSYNENETGEFKKEKEDDAYLSNISVYAIKESLLLNKVPTFANSEMLIGQYEGEFKPFYQKQHAADDLRKMKVKVIFKCTVRNLEDLMKEKGKIK